MQKNDQVKWAVKAGFTCYGVRFVIRASTLEGLRLSRHYLPPKCRRTSAQPKDRLYTIVIGSSEPRSGAKAFNQLSLDDTIVAKSRDLNEVLTALESELKLFVAENSPSGVFIHSGVVGWKGKAILIPGYSFSGKSTLVSELVQAGAIYYSDEYAVIDKQGRVKPYPRPIHLRSEQSSRVAESPAPSRSVSPLRPIPVGLVFVSEYNPRTAWKVKEVPAGQGLLDLLNHTASARKRPKASLLALQKIATSSTILKGPRGEAREAAKALLQQVSQK